MKRLTLLTLLTLLLACGFFFAVSQLAHAHSVITGPWLWMIAPTEANQGGAASTDKDQLDAASGGKVKEADVAKNGAKEGDVVGKLKWTKAEITPKGGNNVNDLVTKIGLGAGDVNDHSSYALIEIESASAQNGVDGWVGSDDSVKVWLNGDVVHKNAINRGAGGFQDKFKVNLKAGKNLLLVKVSERGGGWSMFAGVNADITAAGKKYEFHPPAGKKVVGPYLWMIAPTDAGQGGAASTDKDQLAAASGGAVTEDKVANFGAIEGSAVGKLKWTKAEITPTGGNNVNDLVTKIGFGAGDVNDHSSYAYIVLNSPKPQRTFMFVGSDDSVKVWVNGQAVWTNAVNRGAGDVQDEFPVDLKAGANRVLIKVSERGGGWSMFFAVAAEVEAGIQTAVPVEPAGRMVTTWGSIKGKY